MNSSGAVSPAIRATATMTPVMMPARAAGMTTRRLTIQSGRPSPRPASRSALGTRRTISSVVRSTIGIRIRPSAKPPASAEKRRIGITTTV